MGACLAANASTLSDATARQGADGSAAQVPAQHAPTFQEAVSRLSQYWADKGGCVQYMPMNSEVSTDCDIGIVSMLALVVPENDSPSICARPFCGVVLHGGRAALTHHKGAYSSYAQADQAQSSQR